MSYLYITIALFNTFVILYCFRYLKKTILHLDERFDTVLMDISDSNDQVLKRLENLQTPQTKPLTQQKPNKPKKEKK